MTVGGRAAVARKVSETRRRWTVSDCMTKSGFIPRWEYQGPSLNIRPTRKVSCTNCRTERMHTREFQVYQSTVHGKAVRLSSAITAARLFGSEDSKRMQQRSERHEFLRDRLQMQMMWLKDRQHTHTHMGRPMLNLALYPLWPNDWLLMPQWVFRCFMYTHLHGCFIAPNLPIMQFSSKL